jgi:NADPH-dependent 2,4-dienoyl-CoA reductase/sulfur reductase-like enzyme
MTHYKYLIVGGGMAADEAAKAIRAADRTGSLGMISAEANPPYDRPPLTKDLWKDTPVEDVWRDTGALEIDLHLGREAQVLDATRKRVADDQAIPTPMRSCCWPPAGALFICLSITILIWSSTIEP